MDETLERARNWLVVLVLLLGVIAAWPVFGEAGLVGIVGLAALEFATVVAIAGSAIVADELLL
jgi:hypothetical protein